MRALFIINPTAGSNRARARWAALEPQLRQAGIQADHLFTTESGEATHLARKAASQYGLLIAVGGDGTASEVANGILSAQACNAALGVVPIGTGNDFAKTLGVQTDADAIASLVSGKTKCIDVIEVHCVINGKPIIRYALLFAGVGIVCESLRKTSGAVKRLFGRRMAYYVGLAWALCSYRSPRLRVRCDLETYDKRFLFAGASNTEIAGGGMRIAPGARIDDGQLNVNLVEALGLWRALKQLDRLRRGEHIYHPAVRYLPARELEVDAAGALEVAADGDLIGHTPARFIVRSQALQVRVL
jgi:diacylglycerol kinase (ATP)